MRKEIIISYSSTLFPISLHNCTIEVYDLSFPVLFSI